MTDVFLFRYAFTALFEMIAILKNKAVSNYDTFHIVLYDGSKSNSTFLPS